jgi:hypothetical protein
MSSAYVLTVWRISHKSLIVSTDWLPRLVAISHQPPSLVFTEWVTAALTCPAYNISAQTVQKTQFLFVVLQWLLAKNLLHSNGYCPIVWFAVVAYRFVCLPQYYAVICLEGLRRITNNFSWNSQVSSQDVNQASPKYTSD